VEKNRKEKKAVQHWRQNPCLVYIVFTEAGLLIPASKRCALEFVKKYSKRLKKEILLHRCFLVISNIQRHVVSFFIPDTFQLETISILIGQIQEIT